MAAPPAGAAAGFAGAAGLAGAAAGFAGAAAGLAGAAAGLAGAAAGFAGAAGLAAWRTLDDAFTERNNTVTYKKVNWKTFAMFVVIW